MKQQQKMDSERGKPSEIADRAVAQNEDSRAISIAPALALSPAARILQSFLSESPENS